MDLRQALDARYRQPKVLEADVRLGSRPMIRCRSFLGICAHYPDEALNVDVVLRFKG